MANLIGNGADQVPTNGMLGTAAFCPASMFKTQYGAAVELALGTYTTALTVVWADAARQSVTLGGHTAISFHFVGAPVGVYTLKLTQDATGGRVPTWTTNTPGTTRWLGVVGAPTVNSAANGVSFVQVYWDGALAWGSLGRVNSL